MAEPPREFVWLPAILSFIIPGLGQLTQKRFAWAGAWFASALLIWLVTAFFPILALVVHAASAAEAGLRGTPAV